MNKTNKVTKVNKISTVKLFTHPFELSKILAIN